MTVDISIWMYIVAVHNAYPDSFFGPQTHSNVHFNSNISHWQWKQSIVWKLSALLLVYQTERSILRFNTWRYLFKESQTFTRIIRLFFSGCLAAFVHWPIFPRTFSVLRTHYRKLQEFNRCKCSTEWQHSQSPSVRYHSSDISTFHKHLQFI